MISRPYLLFRGLDPLRNAHHATRPYFHPSRPSTCMHTILSRRCFSTTSSLLDASPNHYETLQVSPTATHAELKKQFYTLSKETHPDRHPDDPNAGERFSRISEAYSVLANPDKRRKYDRDVMRHLQPTPGEKKQGSYFGSRPATGLSKRRGVFRGPPPSYYTHGNPTASKPKSSESSTAGPGPREGGTFNAHTYASDDGSSFDPNPVYRTQTVEDVRRQNRRARAMAEAAEAYENEGNIWARFAVVTGIVLFGITVGGVLFSVGDWTRGGMGGGMVRGDGTRRERRGT